MVAVDASSPARGTNTGAATVTTASHNPPAALLVACCNSNSGSGQSVTHAITNNGTALSWSQIDLANFGSVAQSGAASAFWAPLSSARTGMTDTLTASGTGPIPPSLQLYVVTAADMVTPVGGKAKGGSAANTLAPTSFTVAQAGSVGFWVATDWNANGSPTSSDLTLSPFTSAGNISGCSGYKSLGAAGSSATANIDAPGTAAAAWTWLGFEIKAAVAGITPTVRPVILSAATGRAATY